MHLVAGIILVIGGILLILSFIGTLNEPDETMIQIGCAGAVICVIGGLLFWWAESMK